MKHQGGAIRPAGRMVLRAVNRVLATGPVSRWILGNAVVVFIYHEVSDHPSQFNSMFGLNVRPSAFSKQLDLIREYFHVIDPTDLIREQYPRPAALITFDDGNVSYFQNALPILKEKGTPSVAFLNMGPIRGEVCWSGLVTYLQSFEPGFRGFKGPGSTGEDFCQFTESEVYRYLESVDGNALLERVRRFRGPVAREEHLQAVSRDPLVYLGNHLYNHYNATLLAGRLKEEYQKNQRILEDHPRGVRLFSYPFSRYDDATTRVIRAEGAEALFTVGGLPNLDGGRDVYYRVQLDEAVVTERDMVFRILRNYLPARCRGVARSFRRSRNQVEG